jgi:hypothetical protein
MATTAAIRLQPTTIPPGPFVPARPRLQVLEGGRSPARLARRATYRRRRLGAAALALVLTTGLILATAAVTRTAGGGTPMAVAGASSPTPAAASSAAGVAATRLVQPGDTLWTIASAIAPDVDVRITVERLAELNGRAPLVVGQELVLPER